MEKCSSRAILLMVGSFSVSTGDAGVRFWFTIELSNCSGFCGGVPALSLVCCATGLDCVVGHWQDTRGLALNVAAFEHLHHLIALIIS